MANKRHKPEEIVTKLRQLMYLSGREWRELMRSDRFASWSRLTIAGASSTVVWGQRSSRNLSVFRRRTNG